MNIQMLSDEETNQKLKIYNTFQDKRSNLLNVISKKKSEMLGGSKKSSNVKTFESLSEAETYGTNLQNQSIESLNRSRKILHEDMKIADDIEKKIQENIQTLLAIEDERAQMDTMMVRVGKHIAYFKRTLQTDKLLVCLVFTAILGIIVAVFCYFIFVKN